jgi:hypothetical protein
VDDAVDAVDADDADDADYVNDADYDVNTQDADICDDNESVCSFVNYDTESNTYTHHKGNCDGITHMGYACSCEREFALRKSEFNSELVQTIGNMLENNPSIKPWEIYDEIAIRFKNEFELKYLTIETAQKIDEQFYGNFGEYWRCAYDNPKENDIICEDCGTFASNVGIFTFSKK